MIGRRARLCYVSGSACSERHGPLPSQGRRVGTFLGLFRRHTGMAERAADIALSYHC